MLAIVGVLQVVETQHICLIEPIFWMRVFLYLPKKNMKNGMILPFVTSNMLTRKRPFPREGSLSLVLATEVVIMGWYSQGFGHKNFELLQWPLNFSGGVAGPGYPNDNRSCEQRWISGWRDSSGR